MRHVLLGTLLFRPAHAAGPKPLFDGKALSGWEGERRRRHRPTVA
ncbi:MAG TPA: hypothetical protein VFE78_31185 [Gemmataceae bacterium]|nr:hypothetical protein [Gemmataceae bacterium]